MKTKKVPFDIAKAKAGAKVVTRCGYPVRISDFDVKNKDGYTILGIINIKGNEVPFGFTKTGTRGGKEESDYDLFIEEEEMETCKESSAFCASDDWYKCFRAIADTKPGDILASRDGLDIVIFKKVDDFQFFSSYYNIREKPNICWINKQFIPATKEQKDLLFREMGKAAYEYLQRQPMFNKQILKVLLKQNYDILKEFVSDMVYYAHKAECQDTLSEEDYVIEQLKRRIADDASN